MLLLTDALSPSDGALWTRLEEVQPQVFSAGVAAGLDAEGRPRLQSWASVNAGYYDGITSREQLDVFFERASAWLRRPAEYTLSASVSDEPLAPPGTLTVAEGAKDGAGDAVEFVLDVSGSMLEKTRGGGSRVEVAKKILGETVAGKVPAGTAVAVRVFGRVGGDACGTELSVPVGPPGAVLAALAGIEAKKYAMTPIAAALKEVASDLGAVTGQKTVVLLTDGRETCGGDPAAVLRDLAAQGLGLRVNVVGFALVSKSLKRTFVALAEAGGGQFYDAADGESLAEVLSAAVRAAFVVKDADGQVVARGVVGGAPLSLAAGKYRVEVATAPPQEFDDVEVRDDEARVLSLSEGP